MIRVARTAVGTAIYTAGLVVDTAFATVNQVRCTAMGLLGLGKRKARRVAGNAATSAKNVACDTATRVDQAADTAVEKTVELVDNVSDALDGPDRRPYEERTLEELYPLAVERDINGRSTMNKAELIDALRETQADNSIVEAAVETVKDVIDDGIDRRPYEERTFQELYELAAERDIDGRSTMNKSELIVALRSDR